MECQHLPMDLCQNWNHSLVNLSFPFQAGRLPWALLTAAESKIGTESNNWMGRWHCLWASLSSFFLFSPWGESYYSSFCTNPVVPPGNHVNLWHLSHSRTTSPTSRKFLVRATGSHKRREAQTITPQPLQFFKIPFFKDHWKHLYILGKRLPLIISFQKNESLWNPDIWSYFILHR